MMSAPGDRLLNLFHIKQMFRRAIGPALDVLLTAMTSMKIRRKSPPLRHSLMIELSTSSLLNFVKRGLSYQADKSSRR